MIRAFVKEHAIATPGLDLTIVIVASPEQVLKAFFDADALGAWWQVAHSVTTPRMLGPYADRMDAHRLPRRRPGPPRRRLPRHRHAVRRRVRASSSRIASGCRPTAIRSVRWRSRCACTPAGPDVAAGTRVHVRQSGFEESVRWRRYYEIVGDGWERALASLRSLLEK